MIGATVDGPPVPRHVCERCQEYLPHWCAAEVTITRPKWARRRVITIRDRQAGLEKSAA